MTEEEAYLFFPVNDEAIEERWETVFFEHKQYFLTRPVIAKVFKAKLKKLEKQFIAFKILSGLNEEEGITDHFPLLEIETIVIKAFQSLFNFRSQIKQQLLRVQLPSVLISLVEHWLLEEQKYQQLWFVETADIDTEGIVISKEKDPMILLGALKRWDNNKEKDFKSLKQNLNDLPETLLDEVKRLSLLYKLNS